MISSTSQNYYLKDTKVNEGAGTLSYTQDIIDKESPGINWELCGFLMDNINNTGQFYNHELLVESVTSSTDSVSFEINGKLNDLITKRIIIPKPSEITDYLIEHQDIIDFLIPVTCLVLEYFEDDSQISFELYNDPEIDDRYLVFYIRQNPYQEKIVDIIDELEEKIYNQFPGGTNGLILITTDFNFPKK